MIEIIALQLDKIQSILDFKGFSSYQFRSNLGLGRAALLGTIIGVLLGAHLSLLIVFMALKWHDVWEDRSLMIIQWAIFVISVCIFHLAEFFVTAMYNPTVVSNKSFMVNHSKPYTAALMLACSEFFVRFIFFPSLSRRAICGIGIVLVIFGQTVRSLAMKTAGESFNHVIQLSKKDSHILVTHGIYFYFRHPSYVGFFYWSIGTQFILCNPLNILFYSFASWKFFKSRIPYEEETLKLHFMDYLVYMRKTWIGIPFIWSNYSESSESDKSD